MASAAVAQIFNVTRMTISTWIKGFRADGIDSLIPKVKKPKNTKLLIEQKAIIETWVEGDPQITIRALKNRILEEFGVSIGMTATHKILQKLKFA